MNAKREASAVAVCAFWGILVLTISLGTGGAIGAIRSPAGGSAVQGPTHLESAAKYAATSTGTSTNWGGYAVSTSTGAVSDVKGSWTVPTFKGSCGGLYNVSEAAFWVGIDGYGSSTVEQIGTSIDCTSVLYIGVVTYFAWYEFYPASSVPIAMSIAPGDHISAEVKYTAAHTRYTLTIKDTTTGGSFSTSSSSITANRDSAEWIAEAPSLSSSILPLVDFGTVHFNGCTAVISGHPHAIGGFSNVQITMVNGAGTATKALPGTLSTSGGGFSVVWKSYGP